MDKPIVIFNTVRIIAVTSGFCWAIGSTCVVLQCCKFELHYWIFVFYRVRISLVSYSSCIAIVQE
jgi:hypothetical protein